MVQANADLKESAVWKTGLSEFHCHCFQVPLSASRFSPCASPSWGPTDTLRLSTNQPQSLPQHPGLHIRWCLGSACSIICCCCILAACTHAGPCWLQRCIALVQHPCAWSWQPNDPVRCSHPSGRIESCVLTCVSRLVSKQCVHRICSHGILH